MALYIGLIGIYAFLAVVEECLIRKDALSLKKLVMWNMFLLLPIWFLISFRGESVGTDTYVYHYLFERYGPMPLKESLLTSSMEKGFVGFFNILFHIGISFHGFQVIVATIICMCIGLFIYRYSVNYALSWYLFIVLLFMPRSMNICREMMAVSLSVIAFQFLVDKKIIRFIVSCIMISFIHKTAILQLCVLPILFIKKERYRKLFVAALCFIVVFFFEDIMKLFVNTMGRYSYLLESDYMSVDGGFAQYINILLAIMVCAWYYYSRTKPFLLSSVPQKHSIVGIKYEDKVWKAYIMLALIFSFSGLRFGLADRGALYFTLSFIVILPNFLQKERLSNRVILSVGLVLVTGVYFIAVMSFRNNWHSIVPYMTWWGKQR